MSRPLRLTAAALGLGCAALGNFVPSASAAAAPAEDDDAEDIQQDALTPEQMRAIHAKIDANADGKLSRGEVASFHGHMRKQIAAADVGSVLEEMDTNKDGKLSEEELIQDMEQWGEGEEEASEKGARLALERQKFAAADSDSDGFVDRQELPALFYPETHEGVLALTVKAAMAAKDKDGDSRLSSPEFWEGDVAAESGAVEISDEEHREFSTLDKNGDGFLDETELRAWESGTFHMEEAMGKLFQLADSDGDDEVTAEELAAARDQIAATDAQYHLMEWAEHHEL